MPNINDINGVTVANLAKLDAVLKANISKVNGLTLAAAFTGLLDTYTGAQFAYALRRLATASTTLIRVRRETTGGTGDDDEADVTYDLNNEISLDSAISNASAGVTATTLGEFLNVGTVGGTTYSNPDSLTVTASCHVDTAYDQSGNGYTIENATHSTQPILHDGTVNTDIIRENGKPHMDFGSNYNLARIGQNLNFDQTEFAVYKLGASSSRYLTTATRAHIYGFTGTSLEIFSSPRFTLDSTPPSALMVASFNLSPTAYSGYVNGVAGDSGTGTFTAGNFISMGRTSSGFDGGWSEWICFEDQVSNHGNIQSDINSEYLIYQPTDAPTSGLLATYTGAAAAYSVRQLSDKAVIAMRIRRDSDDEERNIGFDSNGDLATADISAFCGTANGYVVEWADQSTNGNHASQSTVAFQPPIYNGTAVITINGKPGIQHSQSSSHGFVSGSNIGISGTGDRTNFIVAECDNISGNTESTVMSYGASGAGEAWQNTFEPWIRVGSGYQSFSGTTANTQHLLTTALWSGTNVTDSSMFIDGSAATAGAASSRTLNTINSTVVIGGGVSGVGFFSGTVQEILIWASDQSSNRTGIENNINGYFSIYT